MFLVNLKENIDKKNRSKYDKISTTHSGLSGLTSQYNYYNSYTNGAVLSVIWSLQECNSSNNYYDFRGFVLFSSKQLSFKDIEENIKNILN
jgi:hypothetical protein